jgi:3-dehydroquinate dehydratase-2
MSRRIYVLNGPNLNLLGVREPEVYGRETLADVTMACAAAGTRLDLQVDLRQSNHEGQIIDWIQEARAAVAGIIINPAGFTATSIAILDALKTFEGPIIEVHISNVHRREAFRHHSYVSLAATGVIAGLGIQGYVLALEAMARLLEPRA